MKLFGFVVDILNRLKQDDDFLNKLIFSDEVLFHVFGLVHQLNVHSLGTELPPAVN